MSGIIKRKETETIEELIKHFKNCSNCNAVKDEDEFYRYGGGKKNTLYPHCKTCHIDKVKKDRKRREKGYVKIIGGGGLTNNELVDKIRFHINEILEAKKDLILFKRTETFDENEKTNENEHEPRKIEMAKEERDDFLCWLDMELHE